MLRRVAEIIPLVCYKQVRFNCLSKYIVCAYIVADLSQLPAPMPAHSDIPECIL